VTTRSDDLARNYAASLDAHLADAGETALHQAYELGRTALNDGLGVLDIVAVHHTALAALVARSGEAAAPARLSKAADFLAECLSPFEMMLRGYREANARLTASNESLARASAETAAAHERLRAETAERQRVEGALRQSQKLEAIGRLGGGIAHNYNNVLTVVLGNLDMAEPQVADDPDLARMLAMMRRAAERGVKVTKYLLAFSRKQMLRPELIEPSEQLGEIASVLDGSLRGNISVETELSSDLWALRIDPAELELALLNLALNARDAMPDGGVLRIVGANRTLFDERLGLDGNYLVIAVADNGTGIAPEVLPRVFDPFFTTKEIGAGNGLGLSQVHGFAHQSGGAVDIESTLGTGTTVTLYLPAARGAAAAAAAARSTLHEHGTGGTVLVVEDDVEVAQLAADLLKRCGFRVKLAYRARTALDLLQTGEPIDLIFSDIMMPDGMSGIELAEEVRIRFPTIPVLLATGYSDAVLDAIGKGLQIITKPYRTQELCASITGLLRPLQR
jgi:signal transduction histidine kinase/CheY-like chemotaxis protein